jgi:arginase family enzyme
MDLNGYFDPVSLERPGFHFLPEEHSFSRCISVHTPDRPIKNLDDHQLALIGLPQDQQGFIKGSRFAPDAIRGMLYQLRRINRNVKVYDLGNLKITEQINDTYYAIRDITLELIERKIIPFFIGGSQDLSFGVLLALEKMQPLSQVVTIDPRLDFWNDRKGKITSRNYLDYLFDEKKKKHFVYTNIGHQVYFVAEKQMDTLEGNFLETIRLGQARENLPGMEPVIRDADFLGVDMNAIRHSDAPGVTIPSPNGFYGDELCALTRYGGLSSTVKVCGLFECAPDKDLNDQTSHLAAQAVWYFIEGLSHRINEHPSDKLEHTKKYIVSLSETGQELTFHKSTLSDRWWIEVPVKNPVTGHNFFVSCSYEDYEQACSHEIPDRWWRYLQRLGNN